MSNPSKSKGTDFENRTVDGFHAAGFPHVERRALRGTKDGGDIAGIPGVVVQCKNDKRHDPSGWLRELYIQMENANADIGVVIFKKKGTTDPGRQYALTDAAMFMQLLKEAGR